MRAPVRPAGARWLARLNWSVAVLLHLALAIAPAGADEHVESAGWSPPSPDRDLSDKLNKACGEGDSDTCGVEAVRRGDHAYVYPAAAPAPMLSLQAACLKAPDAPFVDRGVVRGVPADFQPWLQPVPAAALGTWIAAEGVLRQPNINTITFCGLRLDDVFLLDWSATEARVRFDLVEFAEAARPPLGTVASRGIFSGGLSIDRSTIATDIHLEDGRFGAFVEIERSRFSGPLRAANTRIDGALRLRDNVFEAAVRLEAMGIGGDTIISGNDFPTRVAEQPREPDGTSFSVVRLRELRLGGVLEFVDNKFVPGESPAMSPGRARARSLYIQKSTIQDNDVTVRGNVFAGRVYLIELEGKKVTVSQNVFDELFELSSSNVYSFRSFANQYLGPFSITNNRLDTSLIIDGDSFDRNATRLLDVRSNRVGHDLRFSPRSWPATDSTVDFSFNQIVGPFSFFWPVNDAEKPRVVDCETSALPRRWQGTINFLGTTVETAMRLVESCADPRFTQLQEFTAPVESSQNGGGHPLPSRSATNSHCPSGGSEPATELDLTLVEVGVLQLDLAPHCQYAWRGQGLTFRYFGAPFSSDIYVVNGNSSLVGYDEERAIGHLIAWLDDVQGPASEIYFFVSDYLRSRGLLNESRDWLENAKRAIYQPQADEPLLQRLADGVVYAALWPAGFGAKPERVIWCMVVLWLVGYGVYTLHYRGWINGAGVFWHRLRHPAPADIYRLPDRDAPAGDGLAEGPMAPPAAPSIFVEPGRVVAAGWAALRDYRQAWERERRDLASAAPALDGNRTNKLGFVTTSADRTARRFSLWSYSLDVTLPILSLGRFGTYSADNALVRGFSYLHHILGWWLGALFIGALTIL